MDDGENKKRSPTRLPTRILTISMPQIGAAEPVSTEAMAYRFGPGGCELIDLPVTGGVDLRKPGMLLWIDVQGTANATLIKNLGRIYGLHELAIDDALHLQQRAKVESYPNHTFIVARMVHYDGRVTLEQLAMFIGDGFVITAQEGSSDGDPFGQIRRELQTSSRRARPATADLLGLTLLDAVVDDYFPVLELFGEALYSLEEEVLNTKDHSVLGRIQGARRDVVTLRRALWPLRDALFMLNRDNFGLGPESRLYLRDTTDHVLRIIDIAEGYREIVASLMDLHMSSMSHRMNETMRVLAVISTIFIPLTFIAGLYGMNFDTSTSSLNMPELESPYGYVTVLGVMFLIAAGMVVFFWRRGWFASANGELEDGPKRSSVRARASPPERSRGQDAGTG